MRIGAQGRGGDALFLPQMKHIWKPISWEREKENQRKAETV